MRPVDPQLLRASAPARVHLAVTFALAGLAAGAIVAQAAFIAHVVSRAVDGTAVGVTTLVALLAVLVGRAVLDGAFEAVGRFGAVRVIADLRGRLAEHLLLRRPGIDGTERTGELTTLAVQGVDAVEPYFARFLPQLALAALVPPAVLLWALGADWIAAAILAGTVPLLLLFMALVGMATQARTEARWATLSLLGSHFLDVIRGLKTLRAHARDRAQADVLASVGERYRVETMGTLRVAFLSAFVLELCATLGTALVAGTIGIQLAGGHLALEQGLVVLLLAPELYAPLRQMGAQFHASADGLTTARRLHEALAEPAAVDEPAHPRVAPDPRRSAVALEDVTFAYRGREGEVLHDVSLTLEPGRMTAVTGPSGAGKSTVAALVLRLADPSCGRVSCGGVDLADVPAADWRARCAWVPQRARIFAGTVAENLRLGAPRAAADRLWDALEAAGLAELVASLPEGLQTVVGDGGRALSAGEAQRLALARAVVRDASLLVLDEPTAHLDEATAAAVDEAIVRVARGRTTLLIAHRPALAALADRQLRIVDGRCVAAPVEAAQVEADVEVLA